MKLLDVLTAPWAIEPAKLLEIQAIYATHLRGDKIDIEAGEKRPGRPLANEPKANVLRYDSLRIKAQAAMTIRAAQEYCHAS